MLKHYLRSTTRKLKQNTSYTLINIFGLSLGVLCATAIFLKVRHELSFEDFHHDADRMYRIVMTDHSYGEIEYKPGVPVPLAPALRLDFPEMEEVVLINQNMFSPVVTFNDEQGLIQKHMEEGGVALVDSNYFRLFSFEALAGDLNHALDEPYTAVISASTAEKYFGNTDAIGKVITFDNLFDLKITAVIKDPPKNTEFPGKLVVSSHLRPEHNRSSDSWGSISSSIQCYLKLKEGINPKALEERFHPFLEKYAGDKRAEENKLSLQPLRDIHFDMDRPTLAENTISKSSIWSLTIIGIFMLLTACINFINLSTALVFKRGKEVGIRKVLGSGKAQIIGHFMGETALLTLISIFTALAMLPFLLDQLAELMGAELAFPTLGDWQFWGFITLIFVVMTVLSGLYPSWLLARLHPVNAIKNQFSKRYGKGLNLRKALIVVQFALSQALIIGTLVMVLQMDHFYSASLGFDKEAVVEFFLPDQDMNKLGPLKQELLSLSGVENVSFSNSGAASNSTWGSNFYYRPESGEIENQTQVKFADVDYLETYKLRLLLGEDLIEVDSTPNRLLVNEAMVEEMQLSSPEEAIGEYLEFWGFKAPISGVVSNFHTSSFHRQIEPVVILNQPRFYFGAVKLQGERFSDVIPKIEAAWNKAFPAYVFESEFLDKTVQEFYEEEARTTSLFQLFAFIAILIGCLGLFGLVSFMAAQRIKEIGIRKVLGATVGNIIEMFGKEFTILVGIGFVLAAPIAYFSMQEWLADFHYHIDWNLWVFSVAILASLAIAYITVGYKSIRAARANPVESLRSE